MQVSDGKSSRSKIAAEQVADIRRKTPRHFSAEDKIRIILEACVTMARSPNCVVVSRDQRVGMDRETVNTVENGVFASSVVVASKIAQALDVSVQELFHLVGK